jgi:hypothetical protein
MNYELSKDKSSQAFGQITKSFWPFLQTEKRI